MKTTIGINGVCGRMGTRVFQLAQDDKEITIGAALERTGHPDLGRDAGEVAGVGSMGLKISADVPLDRRLDAIIDFSTPEGTLTVLPLCVASRIPLVVATTGFTPEQRRQVEEAAH